MINKLFNKIKTIFNNLDKKIILLIKKGLKISFAISIFSALILATYLFFVHSILIYQIGLLVFQISLCLAADFIISGLAVNTILFGKA